jgi:hypothetical protein
LLTYDALCIILLTMTSNKKKNGSGKDFLQVRIVRDESRGANLISKIEKISKTNGLSLNDVANLALAAGLPMVETKLSEIHEPQPA